MTKDLKKNIERYLLDKHTVHTSINKDTYNNILVDVMPILEKHKPIYWVSIGNMLKEEGLYKAINKLSD